MGIVGNQPLRQSHRIHGEDAEQFLELVADLCNQTGMEPRDVVAAFHVLELRRANNIAVEDGDYRDEHIKGLCDAIENISTRLLEITWMVEAMSNLQDGQSEVVQ
jgi:hypothetical protein